METIKRKVGRPSGSFSYIGIKLCDLNRMLQPDTIVLCDKSYSIIARLQSIECRQIDKSDLDILRGAGDESLEMKIIDFSEEKVV